LEYAALFVGEELVAGFESFVILDIDNLSR
jgi:hypothetical protein